MTEDNRPKPDHMLVPVDLTAIDANLIRYAGALAKLLKIQRVTFYHAIPAYELDSKSQMLLESGTNTIDEVIQQKITETVNDCFNYQCYWNVVTTTSQNGVAENILQFIREEAVGLTLIGQKSGYERAEQTGQRLAAEARCDILYVPDLPHVELDKILCAIDFSEAARRAFQRALDLAATTQAELYNYFVTDSTRAYFPATTDRSQQKYQQQLEQSQHEFLQQFRLSPEDVTCLTDLPNAQQGQAAQIYQTALDYDIKLIIIGSRGQADKQTSLLGNLSESFRLLNKRLPVMIVKATEAG